MWDLISLVDFQFDAWKEELWDKIDVDGLQLKLNDMMKKLTNPMLPQNKDMKSWKAFVSMGERCKQMNIILPLIAQLHSPFMMERHWKKLMKMTEKQIAYNSPKFCLNDLSELQLYKFSEDVGELVEGAAKQSKIEFKLNNIQKVWEVETFEFKEYKEIPVLGDIGETVENGE